MIKGLKSSLFFFLFFVLVLAGCGNLENETADPPVDKSINYPYEGAISVLRPINADTYKDSAAIKLYIKNEEAEQGFTTLSDGDNVDPNIPIALGVKVSPDIENAKVFLSDGGKYYKEAFLNENGFYECEFIFNEIVDYKSHPLLAEVIYINESGQPVASKKKIVLATSTDFRAGDKKLVKHGLGVMIDQLVLSGLSGTIHGLLSNLLGLDPKDVIINEFKPADNSTSSEALGVFHINLTLPTDALKGLLDDPFIGFLLDLLGAIFPELDLKFDLIIGDLKEGVRCLSLDLANIFVKGTSSNNWRSVTMPLGFKMSPISFDLGKMLGGIGGGGSEDSGILGMLLGDLELDKKLFINAFGRPDETALDYAALGIGLFVAENDELEEDENGAFIFPVIEEDDTQGKIDLSSIKPKGDFNFGIGLSQYNLNQVLGMIVDGLKITLPASELPIPLGIPKLSSGHSQSLEITLNPAGLIIDMPYMADPSFARLDIMDIRLEYVEDFIPVWILSLDISLKLKIDLHSDGQGGLFLDLEMMPVLDYCHAHVMKDNLGIGIFDHSNLVAILFDTLGGMMAEEGEEVLPDQPFSISLPISSFGIKPDNSAEKAGEINYESGNCFMKLAVNSIDTSAFGCFISTAGSF